MFFGEMHSFKTDHGHFKSSNASCPRLRKNLRHRHSLSCLC